MLKSHAFSPSPDLAEYIRQFYVIEAGIPPGVVIGDLLYAENPFVRVKLSGSWEVVKGDEWVSPDNIMLLGGNQSGLQVRLSGNIRVVAFAIRPSAWRCFFDRPARDLIDGFAPLADDWSEAAEKLATTIEPGMDHEAMVAELESVIRARLAQRPSVAPDKEMSAFEQIARTNSSTRVEDAASQFGLSARQLERRCLASFGLSPKTILRRSRFLDMAAAMKGFGSADEKELAMLRFYDAPHRNREFRWFLGTTPGRFMKAQMPFMLEALRMREAGKVY